MAIFLLPYKHEILLFNGPPTALYRAGLNNICPTDTTITHCVLFPVGVWSCVT